MQTITKAPDSEPVQQEPETPSETITKWISAEAARGLKSADCLTTGQLYEELKDEALKDLPLKVRGNGRYAPVKEILMVGRRAVFLLIKWPSWHPKDKYRTVGELMTSLSSLDREEMVVLTMVAGLRRGLLIWKVEKYADKVVLIPSLHRDTKGESNPKESTSLRILAGDFR